MKETIFTFLDEHVFCTYAENAVMQIDAVILF